MSRALPTHTAALVAAAMAYQALVLPAQAPGPSPAKRRPAEVMGVGGAPWLVRPEREEEEHPEALLDALKLRPGDVVADVGAGVGYFALRMAARVAPAGRVIAVDIQPEMLELLVRNRDAARVTNVEPVLGTEVDPRLAPNSIDLALLVDVYHEFSRPAEMMERIRASLKPSGRLVLVEYRGEDPAVPIRPLHKMTERQVLDEIVPMGFRHVETLGILPRQHILVFAKQQM